MKNKAFELYSKQLEDVFKQSGIENKLCGYWKWTERPNIMINFREKKNCNDYYEGNCIYIDCEPEKKRLYNTGEIVFKEVNADNNLIKGLVLVPLNIEGAPAKYRNGFEEPNNRVFNFILDDMSEHEKWDYSRKWYRFEGSIESGIICIDIKVRTWTWNFIKCYPNDNEIEF